MQNKSQPVIFKGSLGDLWVAQSDLEWSSKNRLVKQNCKQHLPYHPATENVDCASCL